MKFILTGKVHIVAVLCKCSILILQLCKYMHAPGIYDDTGLLNRISDKYVNIDFIAREIYIDSIA